MSSDKITFIGAGNMAGAIINSLTSSEICSIRDISISDPCKEHQEKYARLGANVLNSNIEAASECGLMFLAVKPQVLDSVLNEIRGHIKASCIVSIAAGVSTEHILKTIGPGVPVIRALPNTPMLVLDGITVLAENNDVPSEIFELVKNVFKAAGEVIVLPESKINEAIPMSSSSPAFFFRMLDAMASAGEHMGLTYDDALTLSAVAMRGSANYLMKSSKSPAELIRQVSSPGGTTVAALGAFDDFGFESFIDDAVKRCTERAYELGKKD